MNPPIILLIDLDGVVVDYVAGVKRVFEQNNPGKFLAPVDEFRNYYIQDDYPEWKSELFYAMSNKGLYSNLDLLPGALEALRDIEDNCTDFITPFICSKPDVRYEDQLCFSEKAQFVDKHLGRFWTERLILTQDKTVIFGDLLIDDHPEIIGTMVPAWTQIVFAQSYNAHLGGRRFTWADWTDFKNLALKPMYLNTDLNASAPQPQAQAQGSSPSIILPGQYNARQR